MGHVFAGQYQQQQQVCKYDNCMKPKIQVLAGKANSSLHSPRKFFMLPGCASSSGKSHTAYCTSFITLIASATPHQI